MLLRNRPLFNVGEWLRLSEFEGKPIVLDFWAPWCAACRAQHRYVTELNERYGDRIEVVGVLFNDSPANAREWLAEQGSSYPRVIELDGVLADEFWLGALPYFALLTPDRRLSWDYLGVRRGGGIPDSVEVQLAAMLGP